MKNVMQYVVSIVEAIIGLFILVAAVKVLAPLVSDYLVAWGADLAANASSSFAKGMGSVLSTIAPIVVYGGIILTVVGLLVGAFFYFKKK